MPGDAPQPGSAIQGTGEVPGVGLSSQSPSAQQNFCSSSEQPKRNKCRNSLGWSGEVYPRSLREAKCETAEALAGTLKQSRRDSSQVPVAKLGYCLDLPVEQGCAALGYRTLFLSWKDAPLLCLPCKMTMNTMGTRLSSTASAGASLGASLLSASACLCTQACGKFCQDLCESEVIAF